MILTVVIAAKDASRRLLRCCLASLARLGQASSIEVVVIISGSFPDGCDEDAAAFAAFRRVEVPAQGVYAAYNRGIAEASGRYVLFFGVDDIALPGMDSVIAHLRDATSDYDLFAATSYMQSCGMSAPARQPAGILFRNWCHQGLFYRRLYLAQHPFDISYPIQADHKANIEILGNRRLRVGRSRELVSYFSTGGASQVSYDDRFRRDLPRIAGDNFGRFYRAAVIVKQRVANLVKGRPEVRR